MKAGNIRRIAAAVVQRPDGKVLLLKRSPSHTTNPDKWCFVTGFIETGETPRQAAIRELSEELRVDAGPIRAGERVIVYAGWSTLHVYPFLFKVGNITVHLDWEHTEYTWIEPQEIYQYDFVQQLDEDLIALGLLPGSVNQVENRQ